jgi:8-oxo-dGTP diphosphatase
VAAVIERAGGKILIAQRRAGSAHALQWEFPGGKVDAGETPEAALVRELQEELAIQAVVGPEILRYEYSYAGKAPILLIFFRVTDFSGEPRNRVFERIAWAERRELSSYDFLEGDAEIVKLLRK